MMIVILTPFTLFKTRAANVEIAACTIKAVVEESRTRLTADVTVIRGSLQHSHGIEVDLFHE